MIMCMQCKSISSFNNHAGGKNVPLTIDDGYSMQQTMCILLGTEWAKIFT